MYAVIIAGGKQHKVTTGELIKIEKISLDIGTIFNFDKILLLVNNNNVNSEKSLLNKVIVTAKVISHGYDNKIHIIKFRRRKHHLKHQGHRQMFSTVQITNITF